MTAEEITGILATQYGLCRKGSGATFVRLAILLDDLMQVGGGTAYDICARVFPVEHEAWQRGFDDGAPYAGRMSLRFDNPEWN